MKKVFVFDLDDTLIDNMHDYADPLLDSCRLIIKTLGNKAPHVSKIMAMEQEIDKRRVSEINPDTGKPFLYSMERFPTSLVETYRQICERVGVSVTETVENQLYIIGMNAFDEARYIQNINPNALQILDFLHNQGDTLILCTKGDVRVQTKKVNAFQAIGITHFTKIYIVEDKTTDTFDDIKKEFGRLGALYSVGNSYSSDITPAFSVGFKGILISVETWDIIGKMEATLKEVDRERCFVLKNLQDIQTRYGELK